MAGSPGDGNIRGAAYRPRLGGKTERWRQTLKNRTLLEPSTRPAISNASLPPSWRITTMSANTRAARGESKINGTITQE
jgi:hypothetical protein